MPELPEVQTIVNDLNKKIIGRRITGVWFDSPSQISLYETWKGKSKIIKKPNPKDLKLKIKDLRIAGVKRRGKNILIYLTDNQQPMANDFLLLIHQKLTGHLLIGKWEIRKVAGRKSSVVSLIKGPLKEKVNNYIHFIFNLDNGWQLALSDLRKFAKVLFGPREKIENLPDLAELGPEPLDESFNFSIFQSAIAREKRKIKQVLMDQKVIAGIGNIYSDEILWQAGIHPFKPANKLKTYELKNLYRAMRQVLKKAVKLRGASINDYRDTSGKSGNYAEIRKVYQREGGKCPRCGGIIKRVKIGGRSAYYCPECQKI